ncbi:MAG: 50S ribosomal protein L1 [candidate division Zixibacteria bacterium RBG_16_48_11]|nr:MAG: 50S ribosomal protein L1 [candidate division Zixibacteria bacterium RBG_16_48_11]
MNRGKKYNQALEKAKEKPSYTLEEAVKKLKEVSFAKFNETVEVSLNLGVDPKQADQIVRGTVLMPHGTGRSVKVLVFAKGEKEIEAREAGADYVGAEDLAEKIQSGWLDFEACVATPDVMGLVGKLGKVLGPRGLMPNPKTGTVTFDVAKAVKEVKAGKIEYRVDKQGNVAAPVGKLQFEEKALLSNASAFLQAVLRARPASVKGQYLKSATLSASMSPPLRLDLRAVAELVKSEG